MVHGDAIPRVVLPFVGSPVWPFPLSFVSLSIFVCVNSGKQYQRVFSHPVTASANEACCLSLVTATGQVSLEFESAQVLTLWLGGISHALNAGGQIVQLEQDEKMATQAAPAPVQAQAPQQAQTRGRRYSVMPYVAPPELPLQPQEVAQQMAARRPTLMALSAASTLLLMEEGREFVRYVARAGGAVAAEPVHLWLIQTAGEESLCWCAPGQVLAQPDQRIAIKDITDIWLSDTPLARLERDTLSLRGAISMRA